MKLLRYQYPVTEGIHDLDRWFRSSSSDSFGRLIELADRLSGPAQSRGESSGADLYEDDDHYYARLELPGVKKEDLSLEMHEQRLNVSFVRKSEGVETPASTGKRVIALPEGIEADQVTAKLEDGLLTVSLPKSAEIKPRSIKVS